jgi:hypothetical protein
MYTPT